MTADSYSMEDFWALGISRVTGAKIADGHYMVMASREWEAVGDSIDDAHARLLEMIRQS
jgi:hypothetical protein